MKDKAHASYPEKTTKKDGKKVIVRKEIPIVRIDTANKELIEDLRAADVSFAGQVMVHFVKKGKLYKYDGYLGASLQFLHHAQRLAQPLVLLDNEKDILAFLENKPELYQPDYVGGIINKGGMMERNIDHYVKWLGKNTRVVAFFYGRDEYKDEIN